MAYQPKSRPSSHRIFWGERKRYWILCPAAIALIASAAGREFSPESAKYTHAPRSEFE